MRRGGFVTPSTASELDLARWRLDGMLHGHTPQDVLAFSNYLADQDDEAAVQRDRGGVVAPTEGLDLGPRRRWLGRLLGW
jgi:hypothetical protein